MAEVHFILILEGKEPDGSLLEEAFAGRVPNPGRVMRTSDGMRDYLDGRGVFSNRELFPFPSLVLLDFDYPIMGLNLLQWFKEQGYLSMFPVIGLGRSLPPIIVQRAFDAGINGYFEKPTDLPRLADVICELRWVRDLRRSKEIEGVNVVTRDQFLLGNTST